MIRLVSLLIITLLNFKVLAQATCGNFTKNYQPSTTAAANPEVFEIRDRFGNRYSREELLFSNSITPPPPPSGIGSMSIASNVGTKVTVGMFELHFVAEPAGSAATFGYNDVNNITLVEQVFKDINAMLVNVAPANLGRVDLYFVSDQSIGTVMSGAGSMTGTAGFATGFSVLNNNVTHAIIDNTVYTTIKGGTDAYKNISPLLAPMNTDQGIYHGFVAINFTDYTWNYDPTLTSIIPNDFDLYTVMLHEVIHALGFGSLVANNGSSKIGNNRYARYDDFLFKNSSSAANKVVTYNNTPKTFMPSFTNHALGCTSPNKFIFSGTNTGSQDVYTDATWSDGTNLSHFPCSGSISGGCAAYGLNNYVMSPCVGFGDNYIKRRPHNAEYLALCDMGYAMTGVYGDDQANTTVYKNNYPTCSNPCIAIGKHDYYTTASGVAVSKNYASDVLNNDFPASGNQVERIDLLDPTKGTLTSTASGFTFTPFAGTAGEVFIAYYPKCGVTGKIGSKTYITILVLPPPLPPCVDNGECELICHGGFEESLDQNNWSNFWLTGNQNSTDMYNTDNFGITCRMATPTWKIMCDDMLGSCLFQTKTPDGMKVAPNNGNNFIGIAAHISNHEGVHFKLRRNLQVGKQYRLAFIARKVLNSCMNSKVEVYGDITSPCLPPNLTLLNGTSSACGFIARPLHSTVNPTIINTGDWKKYEMTISPTINISDLLITLEKPIVHELYAKYAAFDSFSLTEIGTNPIKVIAEGDTTPCIDALTREITYKIYWPSTASTASNPAPITLKLTTDNGIVVDKGVGKAFNAAGEHTINTNALDKGKPYILKVLYTLTSPPIQPDQYYSFVLKPISGGCIDLDTSQKYKFRIKPIGNPITITKTVSNTTPALNDNITYTIEVCNKSGQAVSGINVTDIIDPNLSVITLNGFTATNKILSQTISLAAAPSSTSPACTTLTFVAKVLSVCPTENCAEATKTSAPCIKPKSCVTINQGTFPILTISPDNSTICAEGNTNRLLTSTLTPPVTGATYQWFKDGYPIPGATAATYNATEEGTYEVRVQYQGCELKKSTKITKVVLDIIANTNDPYCPLTPATGGSISLYVLNGLAPYSFNWADLVTTQNRSGLKEGLYQVVVSDANGCIRTMTFALNYR